ncbi:Hypothetical_protein [Hexamita inflata]|uniref:Hypothetical_protein n=1 Tax=Hexamita inflata TaxID=28002 RepID=A0ABP1HMR1_9EUKA
MEGQQLLLIQYSFIQYRMTSSNSSGIINQVNQQINLTIFDCKLTGSNLVDSDYNGYVASIIVLPILSLNITNFFVCVQNISALGNQSLSLQINVKLQCDLCGELNVVYGICAESLVQGQFVNNYLLQCIYPFIFNNNQCICDQGFILDQSICVNIIQEIHNIQVDSRLQQRVENVENSVYELDRNIFSQLNSLNHIVQSNFSSLVTTITTLNLSINDIIINQSKQIDQMQEIITNLVQQINCINTAGRFDSCILNSCPIQGQKQINGVCQCTNTNAVVQNNVCVCPENSNVINGICTCSISGQTMQSGVCACPSGQPVVNNQCIVVIITYNTDNTFQCGQGVSVTTFDIQTATNQLTTPLSFSQYQIFASSQVISDAFINILDNVYSTITPLFQSQKDFTNIKIQLATQTMTGGSILVPNTITALSISQMSIISKTGSSISVSQYVNILVASSSNTKINALLVSLNISMSSGSISLIKTVSGIIDITGYQVLGTYQSTNIVAMITLAISATGNIRKVSFKPIVFNIGNCSSYLIGTAASAEFTVSNVAIIIGNSSNQQILSQILSFGQHWQFGGIAASILGSSKIIINNVITDCNQQINTNVSLFSGFIVGQGQSSSSSLSVSNLCQQQKVTSTQQFNQFGLIIGSTNANTTLTQVNTRISIISSSQYNVGILFGSLCALNSSIINVSVIGSNISSSNGYYVGGFIGNAQNSTVKIVNSQIQQIRIVALSYAGIILGYKDGGNTFVFSNSSSTFNYINNNLQRDCPLLKNALSIIGC